MLVVVDDKSGYVWAFGLRKKSETMMIMQSLIKKIEKRLRKRVEFIDADIENDGELLGVSALRCDNAGENVLGAMRRWCDERGTGIETSVPYHHYQIGKAERLSALHCVPW